jgi:hypothetical protein
MTELQKAIEYAASATVALLKATQHNPAQLDLFGGGEPHHVGYTRTNQSGTSSTIAAKNPRPPDVPLAKPAGTTTFIRGDAARHTGRSEMMHGGMFHEVEMLEGHMKGEKKWTQTASTATPAPAVAPVPEPVSNKSNAEKLIDLGWTVKGMFETKPEAVRLFHQSPSASLAEHHGGKWAVLQAPQSTPAFVKPDKRSALAILSELRSADFGYTEAGGNGRTAVDPGGNLTIYDGYFYGGDERQASLKARWTPGGDMHNWFAEKGYDIRMTGSGKNLKSRVFRPTRGSSTHGGDVWVTLAVNKK